MELLCTHKAAVNSQRERRVHRPVARLQMPEPQSVFVEQATPHNSPWGPARTETGSHVAKVRVAVGIDGTVCRKAVQYRLEKKRSPEAN